MSWKYDDPEILSNDTLFRRVPLKPDFLRARDLVDGDVYFMAAAFRHDPDSGMSVSREALLREHGLTPQDTVPSLDTHVAASFSVSVVRQASAGVVDTLGEQLQWVPESSEQADKLRKLPHCHSTVRTPVPVPEKPVWRQIRDAISRAARPAWPVDAASHQPAPAPTSRAHAQIPRQPPDRPQA
jgi:hypothetical protein